MKGRVSVVVAWGFLACSHPPEQGTTYNEYGTKLISFFTAYTAAAHAHNQEIRTTSSS